MGIRSTRALLQLSEDVEAIVRMRLGLTWLLA
jgi:hypothetical protein